MPPRQKIYKKNLKTFSSESVSSDNNKDKKTPIFHSDVKDKKLFQIKVKKRTFRLQNKKAHIIYDDVDDTTKFSNWRKITNWVKAIGLVNTINKAIAPNNLNAIPKCVAIDGKCPECKESSCDRIIGLLPMESTPDIDKFWKSLRPYMTLDGKVDPVHVAKRMTEFFVKETDVDASYLEEHATDFYIYWAILHFFATEIVITNYQVNKSHSTIKPYCLPIGKPTNYITKDSLLRFLSGFGPMHECLQKVVKNCFDDKTGFFKYEFYRYLDENSIVQLLQTNVSEENPRPLVLSRRPPINLVPFALIISYGVYRDDAGNKPPFHPIYNGWSAAQIAIPNVTSLPPWKDKKYKLRFKTMPLRIDLKGFYLKQKSEDTTLTRFNSIPELLQKVEEVGTMTPAQKTTNDQNELLLIRSKLLEYTHFKDDYSLSFEFKKFFLDIVMSYLGESKLSDLRWNLMGRTDHQVKIDDFYPQISASDFGDRVLNSLGERYLLSIIVSFLGHHVYIVTSSSF